MMAACSTIHVVSNALRALAVAPRCDAGIRKHLAGIDSPQEMREPIPPCGNMRTMWHECARVGNNRQSFLHCHACLCHETKHETI